MFIPFEKWTPDDAPKTKNLTKAKNVLWEGNKMLPQLETLQWSTSPVAGYPLLMGECPLNDTELMKSFIMTTSGIYRLDSRVLTNVSQAGGYTIDRTKDTWDYDVYGNTAVYVSRSVAPQLIQPIETGTAVDLGGSPPKAQCCAMFKDHMWLGNVIEGTTLYSRRLWRSKKGDIEDWTPNSNNGCGYYDIPAWGQHLVALKPLGNALVAYMNRSIWLVEEIGSPLWFSHTQLDSGVGTLGPNSVVQLDNNTHLFLGEHGVYFLTMDGVQLASEGLSSYYRDRVDLTRKHRVTSGYDTRRRNAYFNFHTAEDDEYPQTTLVFNYSTGRFTEVSSEAAIFGSMGSAALTIDNMEALGVIDGLKMYALDSQFLNSSVSRIGAVDTNGYVCLFIGSPLDQTIMTGEVDFEDVVTVKRVLPMVELPEDDTTVDVRVYYRFKDNKDNKFKDKQMNSKGNCDLRVTGRYVSFLVRISGYHEGIRGLKIITAERGKR